jgi:hypothetical protein
VSSVTATPFPTKPSEVVALTISEFSAGLDMDGSPSIDDACSRFPRDTNRALVWVIRFRALKAWHAQPGMMEWLDARTVTTQDASHVAAGFELDRHWGFDAGSFCSAIDRARARK